MKRKILAFTIIATLFTTSTSTIYASTINSSNNNLEINISSSDKKYHSAQITFEVDSNIKNFEPNYSGVDVFYKNTLVNSSDNQVKEVTTIIDHNKPIDGLNISYNISKDQIKSPIKIKYLYSDNGKISSVEDKLNVEANKPTDNQNQNNTNNGSSTNNSSKNDKNKNSNDSLNKENKNNKKDKNNNEIFISYSDISNHWANPFITDLASKDIIKGYPDGTFKPNNKIIRGDFFLLVNNIINDKDTISTNNTFKDLNDAYYSNAIKNLADLNIISGYSDNTIKPNNLITREEVAVVIDRLLLHFNKNLDDNNNISFSDNEDISNWAQGSINKLTNNGIINGYTDNTIKPKQDITRGEVAKLLYTVINLK